jgi:ABC-type uncharacterized transport system substrate-binding protein
VERPSSHIAVCPHPWRYALNFRREQEGLKDRGYVVGKILEIEHRWSTGDVQKMNSNAVKLAALKLDAILVASSPAFSCDAATNQSLVFVNVADPIGQGFVRSLARPVFDGRQVD